MVNTNRKEKMTDKEKLKKILKILKINIKQWDETEHDPVEEFKLLVEIINEKN